MKTKKWYYNLEYDDVIHERLGLFILVPLHPIERDFMLAWITTELRSDLETTDYDPADYDLASRFFHVCEGIRYLDDGRFVFDPTGKKTEFDEKDIFLFVHPYMNSNEAGAETGFEYELIWQANGVTYRIAEVGLVNELLKAVKN